MLRVFIVLSLGAIMVLFLWGIFLLEERHTERKLEERSQVIGTKMA